MTSRREFLIATGASLTALGTGRLGLTQTDARNPDLGRGFDLIDEIVPPGGQPAGDPIVVATWHHGQPANAAAWSILAGGGRALDAVETGVRISEADPKVTSVGYGGLPDREGHVTLDACIMDEHGNAGAVAFLQDIKHPVSVARAVMEKSPHVMLVGAGARQFAVAQGFPSEDLLTSDAKREWQKWQQLPQEKAWPAPTDPSQHDTIGQLALDRHGNLSGACTTSGLAFKLHGRVGDSPLIGAGLYVDNEVGAACATGVGEEVIKTVGSFLIVELMRQGLAPAAACREAIARVVRKNPAWRDLQVGFLALNRAGQFSAYAVAPKCQIAVRDAKRDQVMNVPNHREQRGPE